MPDSAAERSRRGADHVTCYAHGQLEARDPRLVPRRRRRDARARAPSSCIAGLVGPGSGDFLAEAADLLDRVGHVALAREYLDRVAAEPKDAAHLVALAAAAIELDTGTRPRGRTAPRPGGGRGGPP